jgi:hypothetical protein
MVFVGWVERSETQHPRWVALRLTQPTNQSLNLAKLMWWSTSTRPHKFCGVCVVRASCSLALSSEQDAR